ncbi:hypothetical protein T190_29495 [Sinorhizobium meliloti CCBAU 01290]|nr:hypothetical protein T190_29495 [Sinorhizobium meliloti CCBAU 01290]
MLGKWRFLRLVGIRAEDVMVSRGRAARHRAGEL